MHEGTKQNAIQSLRERSSQTREIRKGFMGEVRLVLGIKGLVIIQQMKRQREDILNTGSNENKTGEHQSIKN